MAIIDELGRGTSTRDGLSIAIAMAEALIQSRACVWFATHFNDLGEPASLCMPNSSDQSSLAEVLNDRPGVLNLHLATTLAATRDNLPEMTMLYTVKSGKVDNEHYGLTLAKAVGLPSEFLDKAEEVSKSLRQQRDARKQSSEARKLIRRRKLILNLQEQLRHAEAADMDPRDLAGYLTQLQEDFITRMDAIENGVEAAVAGSRDASESMDVVYDDEGIDDESLWEGSGFN